ncbi:MAG: hypothetical protein QM699_07660 [Amaricoccus sp.]|uniref:hypothetical protein n=1 Tax=Amaricoccus sp. TaxID=1872485 RepID=UPI0039E391A1
MTVKLHFQNDEHVRFAEAVEKLGSERAATTAYRRGINRVGDTARTRVQKALAKQVGLTLGGIKTHGSFAVSRANASSLAYAITSRGNHLPLRLFGARQFAYGVRARPWGRWQRFPGVFMFAGHPRSGQLVNARGDAFHRSTLASLPIERMFGPAVPVEMVKGVTADTFERTAATLPKRIAHEVRVLTDGIVTA